LICSSSMLRGLSTSAHTRVGEHQRIARARHDVERRALRDVRAVDQESQAVALVDDRLADWSARCHSRGNPRRGGSTRCTSGRMWRNPSRYAASTRCSFSPSQPRPAPRRWWRPAPPASPGRTSAAGGDQEISLRAMWCQNMRASTPYRVMRAGGSPSRRMPRPRGDVRSRSPRPATPACRRR